MPEEMRSRRRDFAPVEWLNFLAGVWLVISPFVLGYSETRAAISAEITLGIVLIGLSLYVGFRHLTRVMPVDHVGGGDTLLSWIQVPLGVLIILAPFIFGYSTLIGGLIINEILIGLLVIVIGGLVAINHARVEREEREHARMA